MYLFRRKVSIPLWFDSNSVKLNPLPKEMTGLNSTMVRFKFVMIAVNNGYNDRSQFHYGSIQIIPLISFNSKDLGLNSTMVRFKSIGNDKVRLYTEDCLNSTMVRFKLDGNIQSWQE